MIDDRPAKGRDHRTIVLSGKDMGWVGIWPSHRSPGCVFVSIGSTLGGCAVPVPDWFLSSWHAGAPVNGLFDYLLENGLAPPALAGAIRAAYVAEGEGA